MKWHSVTAPEALRRLDTDAARGLTEEAARRRLSESGPNALREKKKTGLAVKFFQQFNDFMIMILLAAAAVSFGVSWINGERDFVDPIIILAIVVLNAVLGLVQESRAEKSLEALKKLSSPAAKVLRDGKCLHIEAEKLTPGDMILLETGDCVPADGRLITSVNLRVGESALTGESSEAEKNAALICPENAPLGDRRNMVFSGGFVAYGRGTAVVTATGMDTEVGRIAGMIMTHEAPETPLQKKLEATGKTLGAVALSICAAIFIMGVIRRIPPFQMFMTSVSLAVAAIPEGLPAIVTIMLALGVQRMAKANAIIRKLPAVETLGGATVICSDKTGTLTQNKMRVAEVECEAGRETILTYAALCSNAILESKGEISGDPTETALVLAALAAGLNKNTLEKRWKRVEEIPFDSDRKLMTTLHRAPDGAYISVTKGAPDVLLNQCTRCAVKGNVMNLTAEKRQEWNAKNAKMADKALRVLAVAYDGDQTHAHENGLIFAGLIGLIDPPRPEAAEAVAVCRQAGIKPVMITGDHVVTARAIAKKIGILSIGDKSITGQDISEMSDGEFARRVEEFSVFARVSPEHKVKIVKALQ
ncbi:MAG: HAD-IC family P-type ATPase, partial [Clostridiales bacterium]|nr:HAD-IC family P-type ATPase [Clostridiales bacterium]